MFLSSYYRSPLDYSEEMLKQSEAGARRISEFSRKLERTMETTGKTELKIQGFDASQEIQNTWQKFLAAMDDDFNTAQAIAIVFDFIRKINPLLDQDLVPENQARKIKNFLKDINKILGIIPSSLKEKIPPEIGRLVDLREKAREEKDWAMADGLRKEVEAMGFRIDDTPFGPYITQK